MKKTRSALLMLVMLLLFGGMTAHAAGDGNADGGGGGLNQGIQAYNWPETSYQGVRITVVDAESGMAVAGPFDFSNMDLSGISEKMVHFGKVSKMQYRDGAALNAQTSLYVYYKPDSPMPQIISGNSSKASIIQIKRYFCSEGAAAMVAARAGMEVEELTDGSYKLVLEPVIYLIYNNLFFAMTTTEAGLYDRMEGGNLGMHFPTVVMKNLALALFLEKDDLEFPAYTGSRTTARTTDELIQILGIGIISYRNAPPTEMEYDAIYRADTDVITSVTLSATDEINPDAAATVTFIMGDRSYKMTGVVIPQNGSQLVWVKWHTPADPCEITIRISADKGSLATTVIRARVEDLNENQPPDPTADDRYDGYERPSLPTGRDITDLNWGVWQCRWHAKWVWVSDWDWESESHGDDCPTDCNTNHGQWVDNGKWEDQGWYDYDRKVYSASLSAAMEIVQDGKNPTASGNRMKSGYGIQMAASAKMSSDAPSSHITQAQTCVAYFPEFYYDDYWRLLERTSLGYSARFQFHKNPYSTYSRRTHFTPVWFPDGDYTVYAKVLDAWTPAGMLQVNLDDALTIRGNLFSDWHVRPLN